MGKLKNGVRLKRQSCISEKSFSYITPHHQIFYRGNHFMRPSRDFSVCIQENTNTEFLSKNGSLLCKHICTLLLLLNHISWRSFHIHKVPTNCFLQLHNILWFVLCLASSLWMDFWISSLLLQWIVLTFFFLTSLTCKYICRVNSKNWNLLTRGNVHFYDGYCQTGLHREVGPTYFPISKIENCRSCLMLKHVLDQLPFQSSLFVSVT